MKKTVLFFMISSAILLIPFYAKAQEKLLLAKTGFENKSELGLVFNQSARVLNYFYTEKDKGILLSLITEPSKDFLAAKGVDLEVIDVNPDLSRFIFLNSPVLNQEEKLSRFGKVFVVSDFYYLVKLTKNGSIPGSVLADFFVLPLENSEVRSPFVKNITPSVGINMPSVEKPISEKKLSSAGIPKGFLIAGLIYFSGVILSIFIIWKKKFVNKKYVMIAAVIAIVLLLGLAVIFNIFFSSSSDILLEDQAVF